MEPVPHSVWGCALAVRRGWGALARAARWPALVWGLGLVPACHRTEQGAFLQEDLQAARVLEDTAFQDQDGHRLRVSAAETGALVVNFIFTRCPTVCPRQTRQLAKVQRALPPTTRVRFLSLSVDPSHDTPAELKELATAQGAVLNNWSFAVASPADTTRVIERLGVFDPSRKASAGAGDHSTSIYLFDRAGRLMQRYGGVPLDQDRLVREIQQVAALTVSGADHFRRP